MYVTLRQRIIFLYASRIICGVSSSGICSDIAAKSRMYFELSSMEKVCTTVLELLLLAYQPRISASLHASPLTQVRVNRDFFASRFESLSSVTPDSTQNLIQVTHVSTTLSIPIKIKTFPRVIGGEYRQIGTAFITQMSNV